LPQKWKHRKQNFDRKASCKKESSGKVVDKKEVKAVIETKEPVKEPVKRRKKRLFGRKRAQKQRRPCRGRLLLSIKNCRELN
jgi:hypothetical protein